jgi:hypothetical protein
MFSVLFVVFWFGLTLLDDIMTYFYNIPMYVKPFLTHDLDYGSYRLSNLEIRLTAGVTPQQGMLTPPWHPTPLLIYSEVRIRPFSDLYFL